MSLPCTECKAFPALYGPEGGCNICEGNLVECLYVEEPMPVEKALPLLTDDFLENEACTWTSITLRDLVGSQQRKIDRLTSQTHGSCVDQLVTEISRVIERWKFKELNDMAGE